MMACLTASERKAFADMLGKIERSLDLIQTAEESHARKDIY